MSDVAHYSITREAKGTASPLRKRRQLILEPMKKSGKSVHSALDILASPGLLDSLQIPTLPNSQTQCMDEETSEFTTLYAGLHKAATTRKFEDALALSERFLKKRPIANALTTLPFLEDAHAYFAARGSKFTYAEIMALTQPNSSEALTDFTHNSIEFADTLMAQIIASKVVGTLGTQDTDLVALLRHLAAFDAALRFKDGYEAAAHESVAGRAISHFVDIEVGIPGWIMHLEPCRLKDIATDTKSPVRDQVAATARYAERMKEIEAMQAGTQPRARRAGGREKVAKQHPNPECAIDDTPTVDPCDCCEDKEPVCMPVDPCCAELNYYVTDTLVLRDSTQCYKAGDLRFIDNIAAGHKRTRTHVFSTKEETYLEEELNTSRSERRDHMVDTTNSLQTQLERQTSTDLSVQAGYDSWPYSLSTDLSLSKSTARSEAREQVRNEVTKAVSELTTEFRELRSNRVTTEERERNKHTFKNESDHANVTKFFGVTKEVKGQVFSYGEQLTLELVLPEPARIYRVLEERKLANGFDQVKPKHPCVMPSHFDPSKEPDIVERLLTQYGLEDVPEPPEVLPPLTRSFSGHYKRDGGGTKWIRELFIEVPDGYRAVKMQLVNPLLQDDISGKKSYCSVRFGGGSVIDTTAGNNKGDNHGPVAINASQSGNAQVECHKIEGAQITLKVWFEAPKPDFGPWQQKVYALIMEKYQAELDAYEQAWQDYKAEALANRTQRHEFEDREILTAELKRAAIFMLCEDFERDGVMNMKTEPCGYPTFNRKAAQAYGWDKYFWERLFDWNLASFVFYDYFWNDQCDWPDRFDPQHPNFLFNSFLRAGLVRYLVPIAKGMEQDALYYLNTGQKWGQSGEPPLDPNDLRWVHAVTEIKHARDCYEEPREGMVVGILDSDDNPTHQVYVSGTLRYRDVGTGLIDAAEIELEENRQIFIGGTAYRLVSIAAGNAPDEWVFTLDRIFEGEAELDQNGDVYPPHAFAIGAEFVGAPFIWEEPTPLVWIGDQDSPCLPCYPVKCE